MPSRCRRGRRTCSTTLLLRQGIGRKQSLVAVASFSIWLLSSSSIFVLKLFPIWLQQKATYAHKSKDSTLRPDPLPTGWLGRSNLARLSALKKFSALGPWIQNAPEPHWRYYFDYAASRVYEFTPSTAWIHQVSYRHRRYRGLSNRSELTDVSYFSYRSD